MLKAGRLLLPALVFSFLIAAATAIRDASDRESVGGRAAARKREAGVPDVRTERRALCGALGRRCGELAVAPWVAAAMSDSDTRGA